MFNKKNVGKIVINNLLFFIYYYGIRFSKDVSYLYIFYLPLIYLGFKILSKLRLNQVKSDIYYGISIILVAVISFIFNKYYEAYFVNFIFNAALNIVITFGVIDLITNKENNLFHEEEDLLKIISLYVVTATVIQTFCIILFHYSYFFKELNELILLADGNIPRKYSVRSLGFSNTGGDGLGFRFIISTIFLGYLLIKKNINRLIFITLIILFTFAEILISRTSLIFGLLTASIFIFYRFKIFEIFLTIFFCFLILLLLPNNFFQLLIGRETLGWALLPFKNGINDPTFKIILSMFSFPGFIKTWLIGDGILSINGENYMSTDIGFCRMIYFFGLSGTFLVMYYIASSFFKFYKNFKDFERKYILSLIFISFIIFNLKTLFLFNGFFIKLFTIFFFIYHRVPLHKGTQSTVGFRGAN